MVINTKQIIQYPIDEYDVEMEIELLELDYCLSKWFYTSYQWSRYERRLKRLQEELQLYLSDARV